MARLKDKVAVVTGAGSGIGRGIALRFAGEGARLAIADIDVDGANSVAAEIEASGGAAFALKTDVTSPSEVDTLFRRVVERFGTVDILVNNAGIAPPSDAAQQERFQRMMAQAMSGGPRESLGITTALSDADWRRMLEVHLFGHFYCTRAALRIMEPRRSGTIINMASVVGITGAAGVPHYASAKAGIIGLTKSVALEVGGVGIRVNAIAPGLIDTPMTAGLPDIAKRMIILRTPLARPGQPDDIAGVALFLASDDSAFVTGEVINVNGGMNT